MTVQLVQFNQFTFLNPKQISHIDLVIDRTRPDECHYQVTMTDGRIYATTKYKINDNDPWWGISGMLDQIAMS